MVKRSRPAAADLKWQSKWRPVEREGEKGSTGQVAARSAIGSAEWRNSSAPTCLLLCDSRLFLGLQLVEKENAHQACICDQNTLRVDGKISKTVVEHWSYILNETDFFINPYWPFHQGNEHALVPTYIPPSCDGVGIEILGHPSELVLGSSVVSSHGWYLVMVLL